MSRLVKDEGKNNKFLDFLMNHTADLVCTLDGEGRFVQVGEAFLHDMGYSRKEVEGCQLGDFLHSEDKAKVWPQVQGLVYEPYQMLKLPDFRFRTAAGTWRWLEAKISNLLPDQEVSALVICFRDVTRQKQAMIQLAESEQRFRSLFENNPAMVFFEDEAGTILDANAPFLAFFNQNKSEIINKSFFSFLPPEVVPFWQQKQKAVFSGKPLSFEVEVDFGELGQKVFTVEKVPLKIDGRVVSVHVVMKDMTAVINRSRFLDQQSQMSMPIFENRTDAFFHLDKDWNFTYINPAFDRIMQTDRKSLIGKKFSDSFPEEVFAAFYQKYQYALETNQSVHFKVFYQKLNKWLEVIAIPGEQGLSAYFSDITDQVRARQELEKLSLVASKTTNGVIILDATGTVEWVNEGFTKLSGFTLPEVSGKRPCDLLSGAETDPAARQRIEEKLRQAENFREELLIYRKSGEKRWLEMEITPVFSDAGELVRHIIIQSDITQRKETEQELQKLSLVASKTTHGVIITDAAGITEWVNEGFTRINGYGFSETINRKPGALLQGPDTDQAEVQRIREKLRQAVPFSATLLNYKKSGEAFWVAMDISPVFDEAGQLVKFIAIQKDITSLKEAEDNMQKMSRELYQHNRDLQQFTYIISHNLRSPIANVMGLTDLLSGFSKDSADFDVALQHLRDSIVRLDAVLRDISLILSVRDRKGVIEKENINIREIFSQALEDLHPSLVQNKGQVVLDIASGLNAHANRAYLHSIFYNLLSNAIKYRSPERQLRLKVKGFVNAKGETIICFADNGSGFDVEKAGENLFRIYKRFHTDVEGKGIGLFLVKEHVEAMGGRIEVKSKIGVGTTFIITLS